MKRYEIVSTHGRGGIGDEKSMTFDGLDMLDALVYIRHLVITLSMTDFHIFSEYACTPRRPRGPTPGQHWPSIVILACKDHYN